MSTQHRDTSGLVAKGVPATLPAWLLYVRGAILLLSFGVLVASAYNVNLTDKYGFYFTYTSGPSAFLIFDSIFTLLILGFMIAAELFGLGHLYYRIAFIVALGLDVVFWLSGWAWAADVASAFYRVYNQFVGTDSELDAYGATLAVGAALGALIWVLTIVVLAFFVIACLRSPSDTAHGHSHGHPTGPTHAPAVHQHNAELDEVKNQPSHAHPHAHPQTQQVPV